MASTFKVVLLGEGRVGKTSIAGRFINDTFDSQEVSTVQASMYSKKKVLIEKKAKDEDQEDRYVDIALWDTAGQERYHALTPIYYRKSNGAVLVYDITDADTFDRIKMWIKELREVVGDDIHIVICGNKSDMEKEREVELAMAERFAKDQGAKHFSTSAKTKLGVSEAFSYLARRIYETEVVGGGSRAGSSYVSSYTKRKGGAAGGGGGGRKGKGGVKIALEDEDGAEGGGEDETMEVGFGGGRADDDEEDYVPIKKDKSKKKKGGVAVAAEDEDDDDANDAWGAPSSSSTKSGKKSGKDTTTAPVSSSAQQRSTAKSASSSEPAPAAAAPKAQPISLEQIDKKSKAQAEEKDKKKGCPC